MNITLVILYSYLLGSIPFGLIYAKIAGLGDVRNIGSGNIGATNVLRTGNKQVAAYTLLSDIAKGSIAVLITNKFFSEYSLLSFLIVYLGHIFPVWLKFKGGKGVATFIGGILITNYILGLVFLITWGVIAKIFKISSLSAIIAFIVTLVITFVFYDFNLTLLMFFFTVFSIYTHRDNIKRIISGDESKIKTK
ncbi:MAG: glycerol-3-phosphate 1-O-acyltransferase PlsY [Pelagibacteraceae bacterium]|jgi:glycerol-3-phosphate acyltransferase PlsY|nr:glycerol-3-phosphate 1-O-acyltransferase PlsY [Pelagibacteraceae bacterium]MCI5079280.1 glycerol-3-phosphate 1-O-acyltransferase PlsY [Pelagibacteraceae bacterium]|tara:strand:+ start:1080 stop:1658 length:579 start_codon:yes stop_codon:yes gene_type:complete